MSLCITCNGDGHLHLPTCHSYESYDEKDCTCRPTRCKDCGGLKVTPTRQLTKKARERLKNAGD